MNTTQQFHVRTILTVTNGRLVTKPGPGRDNGIGDLYKILGWMTSDDPFTHQLGRFAEECKPWLLRWFPELSEANTEDSNNGLTALLADGDAGVDAWWRSLGFQEFYDVPKIPVDDHTPKNPIEELREMLGGTEKIIVVEVD